MTHPKLQFARISLATLWGERGAEHNSTPQNAYDSDCYLMSGAVKASQVHETGFMISLFERVPYHCHCNALRFLIAFGLLSSLGLCQALAHPAITVQPQSQTVIESSNATFSVTAQGTGILTYQWHFKGTNIVGATTSSLSISNVQSLDDGPYTVLVSDDTDSLLSDPAMLTVLLRPRITMHPQSQTVFVGDTVTFTVEVTGTAPFGYRWRRDSITIVPFGAPPALTITNVQLSHAGRYTVVITNAANRTPGVLSEEAALVVNVPTCVSAPTGLVSWWPGEGDAHDIADGNNGIVQGGLGFGMGKVGQAFVFSGVNANVKVPASSNLNVGGASGLTIEMWINPVDVALRPLVEWNNNAGVAGMGAHLWLSVDTAVPGDGVGNLYANLRDTVGNHHQIFSAAGLITTNGFQHVALTYDKETGMAVLYRNGIAVKTQNLGVFTPQTSFDLYFGLRPSGPFSGTYFKGAMDEMSFYSRALSEMEIQSIHNTRSAGKCPPPPSSPFLLDVDFGGGGPGPSPKVGLAATGQTTNDFWNFYTRDDDAGGWRTFGALSNLKLADGTVTPIGMTVANAPGAWGNGSTDPMYDGYIYPFDGGNVTITVTNLPSGQYEVFAYSSDGNYEVRVGGVGYGMKPTYENPVINPPVWTEGVQYARFTNLQVNAGQSMTLTVRPATSGYAIISGMQIAASTFTNSTPPPPSSPFLLDVDFGGGGPGPSPKVGLAATGQTTNDFWNFYTRDDDAGGWRTFGALSNLKLADGTVTPIGMTVANAPGAWGNGSTDPMYDGYIYPFDGGNVTITVTNLPSGQYDVFAYSSDGNYEVSAGGFSYGIELTYENPVINPPGWTEGVQYARFTNVQVNAGQPLLLSVRPGTGGYAIISGIQLAASTSTNSAPQPPCAPPPAGLVSWWQGANNALDSADSNHGTLAGNTVFGAGQAGQGFVFDGSGDAVRLGNPANLRLQNFTIEAWIKRASTSKVTLAPFQTTAAILVYGQAGYGFGLYDDGKLFLTKVGIDNVTLGTGITDTNLHHVAVTKSGSSVVFYIDGVAHSVPAYNSVFAFSTDVAIGARGDNLGSSFYGTIDELAVYNRALSAAELQAIHHAGSSGKCPPPSPPPCVPAPSGLVSWWRAESNALDSTDGNNGTLQNGATFAAGKVGQAFSFDGVDDVVSVADAPTLRFGPTSPMTVDMWVFRTSSNPVQHMIGKRAGCTGSSTEGTFQLALNTDTADGLGFGNPGGSCACSGQDLPLNTWTHLAGTFDGTTLRLFINGQLVATTTGSLGPSNTAPLKIGDSGSCGAAYGAAFAGLIDEVSIYNRALSTNEINAIYNAGSAGKCVVSNPPPVSPVIVSQPTNVTVYVVSNATFRVTATGDAPLSYQWRFDGHDLPGKTSSVLSLTSVQFSNAGPYSVVVSNAGGSITSSNAVLTVNPLPDCTPPPAGIVSWWRAEGNTLDSWGDNHGSLTAKFQAGKVGQGFTAPSNMQVANSPSLQITNALTIEAWVNPSTSSGTAARTIVSKFDYASRVPNAMNSSFFLGTTNSGRPFFVVSPKGSPVTNATLVVAQPLPINQWSFVVATYDGAALRLYVNGVLAAQTHYDGGIFAGTSALGIGALPYLSSFVQPFSGLIDEVSLYNRALTDAEIQAIFNADVVGKCLVAPTIVTQPLDQAIPLGEDVKFTVSVLGTRPLKYQWRFNGTNLLNATNSALVLEKVQTNRVGNYSVFVSNAVGTATSSNAALTLLPPPTCTDTPAGLISWWPGDGNLADAMGTNNFTVFTPTIYVTGKVGQAFSYNGISSYSSVSPATSLNFGSNADFSIEMWIKAGASNTLNTNAPIFEKRSDGSTSWVGYSLSLNQGRLAFAMGTSPIAATNTSRFISPGPDLSDAIFHHVAVSVNRNSTNGGNLYVDGQIVLTFDPTPRKGSLVNNVGLSIGGQSYQKPPYFSGLIDEPAIYNRALTPSEILAIRQAGAAGKCKVKPSILVQPISQRVTVGSNVTFSVTAAGSPLLRYQWLRNSGAIALATNSTYSFTVLTTVNASGDNYSCRVTNLFGTVASSNALLRLNHIPDARGGGALSLNEDTSKPITLLGFDADGDPLTQLIVTPPSHGTITGSEADRVYTPDPNYNGPDRFSYIVNDGLVDSAPATYSLTILPINDPPLAEAGPNQRVNEGALVAFNGGASTDIEGDALMYAWDFGDGSMGFGVAPSHAYADNGVYTVKLTVMDIHNATNMDSLIVTVLNVDPVADAGSDEEEVVGDLVTFGGSFTDAGSADTHTITWDFGDGTNLSPATLTPTHIYSHYGLYTVTLTVTDDDGGVGSDTLTLTLVSALGYLEQTVAKLTLYQANSKKINEVLKRLRKILGREWPDEVHIGPKNGPVIFNGLKQVVDDLTKVLKQNKETLSAEAVAAVQCAIDNLVKAARLLAQTLLIEVDGMTAVDPARQDYVERELAKAREEFNRGEAERQAGQFLKAIDSYRKAWEHATQAEKEATRM